MAALPLARSRIPPATQANARQNISFLHRKSSCEDKEQQVHLMTVFSQVLLNAVLGYLEYFLKLCRLILSCAENILSVPLF